MNTIKLTLFLIIATVMVTLPINAQDEDEAYVVVEYMKVKPGMLDEYMACEAAWKSIHEHRLEKGAITGWELEEVLFPSGTNTEYDFLTITHFKNWNAIGNEDWSEYENILPEASNEIAWNAESYRDLVKREIWSAGEMVFGSDGMHAEIRIENFMHLPQGDMTKWHDMEVKIAKPIMEKSVALGQRAGWITSFMILPRGADLTYSVSTVDMYKDWAQMGVGDEKALMELYPNKTPQQVFGQFNDVRTLVRSEVRRLIDYVE